MGAVDVIAPTRDVRVKQNENPWMNSDILARIKRRDTLLSQYRKDRSNGVLHREFCKIRNAIQRDIKLAKQRYFEQKVDQNKGDSGKLWQQLKSLGYSDKHNKGASKIVIEEDGVKVFEPSKVANIFNRFYTTVAANLVNALPSASGLYSIANSTYRHLRFSRRNYRDTFTLSFVSREFIRQQLVSLNPKKAVGLDGISSRFLKDGADSIVEPISHIVNLSIRTETVPDVFKSAKVTPLFKKGSKLETGNYRPVSILPVLSKILERAVNHQLTEYLERRGLLFKGQSGFRGKYSTDTCTIDLTDYVKGEISRGNMVGMVMIDLQKAFDTVNHEVLLEKMEAMGITSIQWFRSYLSHRNQCVSVDGEVSDFLEISCGVPQGSILGPQLFLLYINDMVSSVENCRLLLYADDSALIYSHKSYEVIARMLSTDLSSCKQWLIDNKLSLHVGKTESILFGTSKRLKAAEEFSVSCDGAIVKRVSTVKYLGIYLDERMKGTSHASDVVKKCAGRISFLYRNASLLNFHCRKILCTALIVPYMDYCCSSWYSGITKKLQDKLDVIQRRLIRFIFSLDARAHVGTEKLRELSWLSIRDRVSYFKLNHVFKIKNGTAPDYLSSKFVLVSESHSHNTRGCVHNYIVTNQQAKVQTSFQFSAIREWNNLPDEIKGAGSLFSFRKKLKQHFLSRY